MRGLILALLLSACCPIPADFPCIPADTNRDCDVFDPGLT